MVLRIVKIVLVTVAIATTAVGLYSHFSSDWVKKFDDVIESEANSNILETAEIKRLYDVCKGWNPRRYPDLETLLPIAPKDVLSFLEKLLDLKCPNIVMEHFFVGTIIVSFIYSVISLVISFAVSNNSPVTIGDVGVNIIIAIILLMSGVVYIVDAKEIKNIFNFIQGHLQHFIYIVDVLIGGGITGIGDAFMKAKGSLPDLESLFKQRHAEKLAAGILAIVQSVIHLVIAVLGCRIQIQMRKETETKKS